MPVAWAAVSRLCNAIFKRHDVSLSLEVYLLQTHVWCLWSTAQNYRRRQQSCNKSSAVVEMAAQCCTSRIVKRWGGSIVEKNRREARMRGHES